MDTRTLASLALVGLGALSGCKETVDSQNIRTQEVRHVNSCFFTMVAVDDDRKPAAVPALRPFSAYERRRFEAAKVRKQLRQEMEQRLQATRQDG